MLDGRLRHWRDEIARRHGPEFDRHAAQGEFANRADHGARLFAPDVFLAAEVFRRCDIRHVFLVGKTGFGGMKGSAKRKDQNLLLVRGDSARREAGRSEEHTSELQSLMRTTYAVFCGKDKRGEGGRGGGR